MSQKPIGRVTRLRLALTPQERATLTRWQRTYSLPASRVRRARMILLVAEGLPLTDVARTVGISRRFVYKWVARFQAEGCQGLYDRVRPERRLARQEAP